MKHKKYRCKHCDWSGTEIDLMSVSLSPGSKDFMVCPDCCTDSGLTPVKPESDKSNNDNSQRK